MGTEYGCVCDCEVGEQPYPDCVFDTGDIGDCRIAKTINGKAECKYWKPVKWAAAKKEQEHE